MKSTTEKRIFMFLELYILGLIGGFLIQYFKYSNIADIDFYSVISIPLGFSIGVIFPEVFKRKIKKEKR